MLSKYVIGLSFDGIVNLYMLHFDISLLLTGSLVSEILLVNLMFLFEIKLSRDFLTLFCANAFVDKTMAVANIMHRLKVRFVIFMIFCYFVYLYVMFTADEATARSNDSDGGSRTGRMMNPSCC